MVDIKVNTEDINKLLYKISQLDGYAENQLEQNFMITASAISRRAKIDVPKRTGFLASTISYGKDKNVYVQAAAKYAPYVEHGTKPHTIRVKNKSVLYNDNTKTFFGKEVRHPGTKPRPYFYQNAKIEINLLYKKLRKNIKRIIR